MVGGTTGYHFYGLIEIHVTSESTCRCFLFVPPLAVCGNLHRELCKCRASYLVRRWESSMELLPFVAQCEWSSQVCWPKNWIIWYHLTQWLTHMFPWTISKWPYSSSMPSCPVPHGDLQSLYQVTPLWHLAANQKNLSTDGDSNEDVFIEDERFWIHHHHEISWIMIK